MRSLPNGLWAVCLVLCLGLVSSACSQTSDEATTSTTESVATAPTTVTTTNSTLAPTTTTSPTSLADETVTPATFSLTLEDGTRVEGTFIDQQDLARAYCSGEMASMRSLELDASDSPDDFLPLISDESLREYCAAFGTPASATTIEQSFCIG